MIWSRFIEQKSEETGWSPPSCPPPGWTWPSACRRCPPCATSRRCCLTPGQDWFGRVGSVWRRKGHLHLLNITLDEDRHRPNVFHVDNIPGFKSEKMQKISSRIHLASKSLKRCVVRILLFECGVVPGEAAALRHFNSGKCAASTFFETLIKIFQDFFYLKDFTMITSHVFCWNNLLCLTLSLHPGKNWPKSDAFSVRLLKTTIVIDSQLTRAVTRSGSRIMWWNHCWALV